jgi:hypothetical protein
VQAPDALKLFDDAVPLIARVDSPRGAGEARAEVDMSTPSEVALTVRKAPRGTAAAGWHVLLGDAAPLVAWASADAATREGRIVFTAPGSSAAGPVWGLLAFAPPAEGCGAACCADRSCGTACGDAATACFALEYVDTREPALTFPGADAGALRGPALGGAVLRVVADNFPPLAAAAEVEVRFGGGGDGPAAGTLAGVQLVSTEEKAKPPPPPPSRTDWTRLVPPPVLTGHVSAQDGRARVELAVVTPPHALGGAPSARVAARVAPRARPDLAVEFEYEYVAVEPRVTFVGPAAGPNDRASTVYVVAEFLQPGPASPCSPPPSY